MLKPADLKPLQRQALLAALHTPTGTLHRCRKGYAATPAAHRSGDQRVPAFTNRVMNQLEREGLVRFEPPQWPDQVTLTSEGRALAAQLRTPDAAKAVAS
jgi:hypothetical protein